MRTTTISRHWVTMAAAALAIVLAVSFVMLAPASAQSGGCPNGPFPGATPTDSDGDGVSDADEILAGSDECDPNSIVSPPPPTPEPPQLALTGPSTATMALVVGMALIIVGTASLSLGRRAEH